MCHIHLSITSAWQKVYLMDKWSPHWPILSHLPLCPPLYPSLPGISLEHSWFENIWRLRTFNFWSLCFHLLLSPLSPKDLPGLPLYNQPLKDTTILWGRAALHQARHGDLTSLLTHLTEPVPEILTQATVNGVPWKPTGKILTQTWKDGKDSENSRKRFR